MTVWIKIPSMKSKLVPIENIDFLDPKSPDGLPREGVSYVFMRKLTRQSLMRDDRDPETPVEERAVTVIMAEDAVSDIALQATDLTRDDLVPEKRTRGRRAKTS